MSSEQPSLASFPLHIAVAKQNLAEVRSLLEKKADVNVDDFGRTALKIAVRQKGCFSTQILNELLAAKANLAAPATDFDPPLFLAVRSDNAEAVRLLIAAKADVNHSNPFGETALHLTATNKDLDVINALLEYKADANRQDKAGKTPLPGILAIIERPFTHQSLASNPLLLAVAKQDLKQTRLLLAKKADVNSTMNGRTALKIAVRQKGALSIQILKELLAAKANLTTPAIDLYPPLFLAARSENAEAVRILIEAKTDVNHSNLLGETALHLLSTYTNLDTVNVLLEHKADVNKKTVVGEAPLLLMVDKAKINPSVYLSITRLIEARADVNTLDRNGNIFLIKAFGHEYPKKLVDILLTAKSDIDSHLLQSLLSWACSQRDLEMVAALLDYKANINGEHLQGITPLTQVLKSTEHYVNSLAPPNPPISREMHLQMHLHRTRLRYLQMLDLLIKRKANINHRHDRGEPMLSLAIKTFLPDVVHMLLAAKANPFAVNTSLYEKEQGEEYDKEILRIIKQAQKKQQSLSFLGVFHQRTGARAAISLLQEHSHFERQLPRIIFSLAGSQSATKPASLTKEVPTKSS